MRNVYEKAFIKSFLFRVVVNIIFIVAAHIAMRDMLNILTNYATDISNVSGEVIKNEMLFNTASYIFDETSIMATQSGLLVVAIMALIFGLDCFKINEIETDTMFRKRLLLYTIAHLFSCLVMTLYLFISVGVLSYPQSLRLNEFNSFIWAYPSYAIIAVIYIVDLYKFYTVNTCLSCSVES